MEEDLNVTDTNCQTPTPMGQKQHLHIVKNKDILEPEQRTLASTLNVSVQALSQARIQVLLLPSSTAPQICRLWKGQQLQSAVSSAAKRSETAPRNS